MSIRSTHIFVSMGLIIQGVVPDDGRVIAVKNLQENAPMPPDKTFNNEVQNIRALHLAVSTFPCLELGHFDLQMLV